MCFCLSALYGTVPGLLCFLLLSFLLFSLSSMTRFVAAAFLIALGTCRCLSCGCEKYGVVLGVSIVWGRGQAILFFDAHS